MLQIRQIYSLKKNLYRNFVLYCNDCMYSYFQWLKVEVNVFMSNYSWYVGFNKFVLYLFIWNFLCDQYLFNGFYFVDGFGYF